MIRNKRDNKVAKAYAKNIAALRTCWDQETKDKNLTE